MADQPPPRFEPAARPPRRGPGDAAEPIVVGRPPQPTTPRRPARQVPPVAGRTASGSQASAPPRPQRVPARPGTAGAATGAAVGAGAQARSTTPPAITPRGAGPGRPTAGDAAPAVPAQPPRPRRRRGRTVAAVLVVLLVLVLAWPVGLAVWANGRLERVEATSGAEGTPGTTYLLAGSDSREEGMVHDATEGARTDTIMLLHVPASGPAALLSLPRDSFVEIPGHGPGKLNSAFTLGGAPLLVSTVEGATGLTVDHYVEIGFAGVASVVDAVGGVELCLDYDVDDEKSKLVWTAGCHTTNGTVALAFARMRYSDPEGDIGRGARQQQLIQAVTKEAADPGILWRPTEQVALVRAGTDALTVSEGTSIVDLGKLALGFRAATGPEGVRGTPWIADPDYRPGGVGSTVLLDEEANAQLFADLIAGTLPPGPVGGMPEDLG